MRLVLVRHGETDWNVAGRFRGRADVPLNDRGKRQAMATAARIARTWQPSAIYTSPIARAAQTAAPIESETKIEARHDTRLSDIDYGAWQGLTRADVAEAFPAELALFESTPSSLRIPRGEDFTSVRRRVVAFLEEIEAKHASETIVAVAHTEVNRILLLVALGLATDALWRIEQYPCALNELDVTNGRWTVVTMNDTSHLGSTT